MFGNWSLCRNRRQDDTLCLVDVEHGFGQTQDYQNKIDYVLHSIQETIINHWQSGHSFPSIFDFSSRLKGSGVISDISPLQVPYLTIKSCSSTVMDLSNQFLPFCSHCHYHISDLHYHSLFCHNTGFMLISPENAIRLIFINCNSRHVTHLLRNVQQLHNAKSIKSMHVSLEFKMSPVS